MNAVVTTIEPAHKPKLLERMADRFGIQADKMLSTLKATAFRGEVSNEQMMALLVVSEQYNLNPWTKEIYAFPDRNNGIVPVVGVDGWLRIINSNPQFDGMDFKDGPIAGANIPEWIECTIYRKDRSHPITAREYFDEVRRDVGPWKSHPRRMLRHKALIQAARIAFAFVGIYDDDEAQRIIEAAPVVGDRSGRPDTSQVDTALADKWVGQITDLLAEDIEGDHDGYKKAENLREVNTELSKFPDLMTVVYDALASRGIISKANYRKMIALKRPE